MKYIWRDGQWTPKPERDYSQPWGMIVMRDIPEYRSPLGTGLITSRSHRREDLKRGGCREVDPSERHSWGDSKPQTWLDKTAERDKAIAGDPPPFLRGPDNSRK